MTDILLTPRVDDMASTTKSKLKREENRKKKYAALLQIAELNDKEREDASIRCHPASESEEPASKKSKIDCDNACASEGGNIKNEPVGEINTLMKVPEADLTELRALLRERRKALKKIPMFRLKEPSGSEADVNFPASQRMPIFLSDIQHLVSFSVLLQTSPFIPRWCHVDKCSALSSMRVLFIEGVGISDYLQCRDTLTSLSESNFPHQLEVVMPAAYDGDLVEELCAVPLSWQQGKSLLEAHGSLEEAVKSGGEVFKVLQAFFPIQPKTFKVKSKKTENGSNKEDSKNSTALSESLPPSDKFPRTALLLSAWQMVEEGYPIALNATLNEKFKDFVPTKQCYSQVSNSSPMYGLDCEMCVTTSGKSELTRVAIVNEKLETILDTLVLPHNRITNYLTQFSGITAKMMKNVQTRLKDVQKWIQEHLEPDAILVGQSLNFDLIALKMMHPYCIDTGVIFNLTGDRYRKSKLKILTEYFLKEEIQSSRKSGHNPVEDSSASLKLVQLKLSKSITFGDKVLENKIFPPCNVLENGANQSSNEANKSKSSSEVVDLSGYATSLFSYACRMKKNSTIVGSAEIIEKYIDFLNPKYTCYEQINEEGPPKVISKIEKTDFGCVTCVITPLRNYVTDQVVAKSLENFLTIGHIKLSQEESSGLSVGDSKILQMLNDWVSIFKEGAHLNGLSLVVLCGREKSSNGVCFVDLRKKPFERLNINLRNNATPTS